MTDTTAAPIYPLVIGQGTTLRRTFIWKDVDGVPIPLTNYAARMQVREEYETTTPLLSLSSATPTSDGTLTIVGAAGKIIMVVPADVTAALEFDVAVWDLEVESLAGEVTRLCQGPVLLDREVTR